MNIPRLRAMLLNIFKDIANLSKSFNKDKVTTEVLKKVYRQRKEYVKKYADNAEMESFLNNWYKYFFGCVAGLLNEGVTTDELAEFYTLLYTVTENYVRTKILSYDEIDNLGAMVGKGFKMADKYAYDAFPNKWFSELTQCIFNEILLIEEKKQKICTQ